MKEERNRWLGQYWDLIKSGKLTFNQANTIHEDLKDKPEDYKELLFSYLKEDKDDEKK